MVYRRKNLLKAFVLLALTSGLTTDLNAQTEEKQSITVGFNPTTSLFQQLLTKRPAAQDVRTIHNVPFSNRQVEVNWSQLGNGSMVLASLSYACNHFNTIRNIDEFFSMHQNIQSDVNRIAIGNGRSMLDEHSRSINNQYQRNAYYAISIMMSCAVIFGYKYAIGEQKIPFRVVNQQEEASSQEA